MSDLPAVYSPRPSFQWSWIDFSGPDAQDFLHRLTTIHVRALEPGQGHNGCFLTAQGKIRAYFTLWCLAPGQYGFELDAGPEDKWKQELLACIDQYTFGEKISVAEPRDRECRWVFGELPSSAPAPASGKTALVNGIRLCHHGANDFGRPWISAWGEPAALDAWLVGAFPGSRTAAYDELDAWRIGALRPRTGLELTEGTNPLELGLLDAIDENKGCYPGQEVIEKIISLGSPARRLCLIEGQGPAPAPGEKIKTADAAEVGTLTSVRPRDGGFVALGFVRKTHAKEGTELRFGGGAVQAIVVRVAPYA